MVKVADHAATHAPCQSHCPCFQDVAFYIPIRFLIRFMSAHLLHRTPGPFAQEVICPVDQYVVFTPTKEA